MPTKHLQNRSGKNRPRTHRIACWKKANSSRREEARQKTAATYSKQTLESSVFMGAKAIRNLIQFNLKHIRKRTDKRRDTKNKPAIMDQLVSECGLWMHHVPKIS